MLENVDLSVQLHACTYNGWVGMKLGRSVDGWVFW